LDETSWILRVSSAVSPSRSSTVIFSIRTALFGLATSSVSRFPLDLAFHPSGEPRPSPASRSPVGDSGWNKSARSVERARVVGHRTGCSLH
jgi:hypothetical protein